MTVALNDQLLKPKAFIDGTWIDADDGSTADVVNPATGAVVATVPMLGQAETERAIASADAAFRSWRKRTANERAEVLSRWHQLILENADDLAAILTAEQGKPLFEAKAEVEAAASFFKWFSEEARRIYGDIVSAPRAEQRILVTKEPVGVCAAITPWNFPISMIARKAAPAIAAGCAIVVKPAMMTPFSSLAMAELGRQAGLPDGVLNVVTGDAKVVGGTLMASPTVRKITFTGSTPVGKLLMRQAADTVKKVSMELGGNAPFIVFDDADMDQAVSGIIASKFRNAGQTCVCANRIFVQEGIHNAFLDKLVGAVEAFKIGNGMDEGVTIGPLINEGALKSMESVVQGAASAGAVIATGGKPHALGGNFFEPTVVTGVDNSMDIAQKEIFGPIAPIIPFRTEDEVIAMANDTPYGLAAYFFTRDMARGFRVSEALEYGMIGLNDVAISVAEAPFGGVKESGVGREGSRHGIDEYVEIKYLSIGAITPVAKVA